MEPPITIARRDLVSFKGSVPAGSQVGKISYIVCICFLEECHGSDDDG
jgi:hypothetical protein